MKKESLRSTSKQMNQVTEDVQLDYLKTTCLLIERAFDVINMREDVCSMDENILNATMESVMSLIEGINPQDTVETVLASQFISTHFQGSYHLAKNNITHGMMLMRLSHQALEMLQKYRNKGSNINVNYLVKNEGEALIQTNIGKNLEKKGL